MKIISIYLVMLVCVTATCIQHQSTSVAVKDAIPSANKEQQLNFTTAIRALFQDSKGNYWFGSDREGVARLDANGFTYFNTTNGLLGNQIFSIQEDSFGNIWFESSNGASCYNGALITNYSINAMNNLPAQWALSSKDLWFNAGNNEGVLRFNGTHLNYLPLPVAKPSNPGNKYAVTDFSKAKDGAIWIATYPGVFGYNGKDFTIINDELLGFNEPTLHIRSILSDSKGRLWIGNNGIGVQLKEGDSVINFSKKYKVMRTTKIENTNKSLPGTLEHVFQIAEDSAGNIWFGDRDTGAWKFDGNTLVNYNEDSGLTRDFVTCIYKDNKGTLWMGLDDGSVYIFNNDKFVKQF